MNRDEMIAKIIEYLENIRDVSGKTALDYPGYQKLKAFLLKEKDSIDERILLMGDVLAPVLDSTIRIAKTAEDFNIGFGFGHLFVAANESPDRDHISGEIVCFAPSDRGGHCDVQQFTKIIRATKNKEIDTTYDANITYIDKWYDSKTGKQESSSQLRSEGKYYRITEKNQIYGLDKGVINFIGKTGPYLLLDGFYYPDKYIESSHSHRINDAVNIDILRREGKEFTDYSPSNSFYVNNGHFLSTPPEELESRTKKLKEMNESEKNDYIESLKIYAEEGDGYGYVTQFLGLDKIREENTKKR